MLAAKIRTAWLCLEHWNITSQRVGRVWEQRTTGGCPWPYSHAPIDSLSVPPLLGTAQSHPSFLPLWEAPGRTTVTEVLMCVCRADDHLSHHMGPEEFQPSQHRGASQHGDAFQQVAERIQTPEMRWHQWWWNISNTEINSRMRRDLLAKAGDLGKAGMPTQGGESPAQSFQQQLKLPKSLQWEQTSLPWWFKTSESGSCF